MAVNSSPNANDRVLLSQSLQRKLQKCVIDKLSSHQLIPKQEGLGDSSKSLLSKFDQSLNDSSVKQQAGPEYVEKSEIEMPINEKKRPDAGKSSLIVGAKVNDKANASEKKSKPICDDSKGHMIQQESNQKLEVP